MVPGNSDIVIVTDREGVGVPAAMRWRLHGGTKEGVKHASILPKHALHGVSQCVRVVISAEGSGISFPVGLMDRMRNMTTDMANVRKGYIRYSILQGIVYPFTAQHDYRYGQRA